MSVKCLSCRIKCFQQNKSNILKSKIKDFVFNSTRLKADIFGEINSRKIWKIVGKCVGSNWTDRSVLLFTDIFI